MIICPLQAHFLCFLETGERLSLVDSHTPTSHPGNTERGTRGSLKFKSNRCGRVPSMFYYQRFRKAVWVKQAAVSFNYQDIKMYLRTTKDCLREFLFSALFQGENQGVIFNRFALDVQSEQADIPGDTGNCWWLDRGQR